MKNGTFTYSLLQYHHSQLLGEVINIGLIVYFPDSSRLEFIYPEKLLRLRYAYPSVPEKTIKSYFKYFRTRVDELNQQKDAFTEYGLEKSLKSFLESEFLPSDSSALQFGNYRTSVLYTTNIEHILNQLYNLYFSVFKIEDNAGKRVNESHLLIRYKNLLKEGIAQEQEIKSAKHLQFDYDIHFGNETLESNYRFDVAWKEKNNLHLVKPVSFDLLRAETIERKAYTYYGRFLDLQEYAYGSNAEFDLLLAKPKNRTLHKAYDNAIRLLEKPNRVNLIEQEQLISYTERTIEAISKQ